MRSETRPSFVGTVCLCLLLAGGLGYIIVRDTGGLRHWTFEAQRRQSVKQAKLTVPAVTLRDQHSVPWQPWPGADPGTIYIVDFIYTRCPSFCQGLGAQFRQMQQDLMHQPSPIRLVSISFDPRHDDASRIAEYVHRHGADAAWWRVTAPIDESALKSLLRRIGVVAIDDGSGGYVHNSALHLIDHSGQVRNIYDYGDWRSALADARRLAGDHREHDTIAADIR